MPRSGLAAHISHVSARSIAINWCLLLPLSLCRPAPRPAVVPERIEGMPLTEVRFVNIKLISLAELKLITERGAEGRRKLSELLGGEDRLVSSIGRDSVL